MNKNIKKLAADGLLICPRCKSGLAVTESMRCSGCGQLFPFLGKIPVLLDRPEERISHWWQQYLNFVQVQQQAIAYEKKLIDAPSTYPPFRNRLEAIVRARYENMTAVGNMVMPMQELMQEPWVFPRSATKSAFDFTSFLYLIRDWGWDTGEPEIMCEKVIEILPEQLSVESLLVLGAGGCRESYILHNYYKCPHTVSVDIDPCKLMGAETIISGSELNLYQILSNNIRDEQGHVSYWKLRAPEEPDNMFHYILADVRTLPFKESTFQIIFTPFLIDAVGEDFRLFAKRIEHILKPGGYWVNYGAMNFRPEVAYTGNEILSILADTGLQVINKGYSSSPHMAPRESCLRQVFDCLYFLARKDGS